eukprot:contig_18988_g4687
MRRTPGIQCVRLNGHICNSQRVTCARCATRVRSTLARPHRHVPTAWAPVVPSERAAFTPVIPSMVIKTCRTQGTHRRTPRPRYKRVATTKREDRRAAYLVIDARPASTGLALACCVERKAL